jgi:hypothetical protein
MRDLLRLSAKQLSARNGDVFKQHCSVTESKGMDKKPAAGICHNYNSGGYKKPVKPEAEKEKESSAAFAAPIASISVVESLRCDKDFHGFSLLQLSYPRESNLDSKSGF